MARKKTPDAPAVLEIDGVPTAEGLIQQGREYAHRTGTGHIHITAAGHALLGDHLRTNARTALNEGTWHGITGKHPRPPAR